MAGARDFCIVGIGASAGGLEAFETFFRACPADSGMAFVLVPHLDPDHQSLLTEILQRSTRMPVVEALDQVAVASDHVYVIPPNREMAILGGVLQLSTPERARGQRMPIDAFLRSLAEDAAEHAIGIILSGTATDGTQGLRAIVGAGGVGMVQDPATAKYDGMPRSAIASGYATHILPAQEMPAKLLEIAKKGVLRPPAPSIAGAGTRSGFNQILLQLRSSTGHDFSLYKKSTIGRRIQRRMDQNRIADETVYARFLRDTPDEARALFKELLINVTSFFRDAEAFAVLKRDLLPSLLAGKGEGGEFRVWVAGCATGEEAYSIAIVLLELMETIRAQHGPEPTIQIYATDLDDEGIAVARAGRYPPNIVQDVTPERLARYFTKDEGGYKVKKELRDMVVFAVQNVVRDPPFTRLDLLSCRNLLIYLEPELQSRLIPTFRYALRPGGVLFLSTSESITSRPDLFAPLDRKWKFYRAIAGGQTHIPSTGVGWSWATPLPGPGAVAAGAKAGSTSSASIATLSAQALLRAYAPASVTTDHLGNVLHVHGDTGRYLRPAPGPISNNVVEMAREGLQPELRQALQLVAQAKATLTREIMVKTNGGFSPVRLSVQPLAAQGGSPELILISFQEAPADPAGFGQGPPTQGPRRGARATAPAVAQVDRVKELESELAYLRENLRVSSEEQQAANEELRSTNEELQSTNEELQSSNEELETAKEELQSLNEETITVNAELNAKIEQLTGVQNDLKNLLDSVNTATLFLDRQLAIRRYTPATTMIYRLIHTDIGRPLGDITSNLRGADLQTELRSVLDSLVPIEREVRTADGAWYLARIQPYRTYDNVIDGVVLTFTAVSDFKLAGDASRRTTAHVCATELLRELAAGLVGLIVAPFAVLDGGLQLVSASPAFFQYINVQAQEAIGRSIYELAEGRLDLPVLRDLLEHVLPRDQALHQAVVERDIPGSGWQRMTVNARRTVMSACDAQMIVLVIEPVDAGGQA